MQLADYVTALLVRMLSYGAGVHEKYVRALAPRHSLESFFQKLPLICGRLSVIQLASQGNECYSHQ